MSLQQLYQQKIKHHNQFPVGADAEFIATHQAEGYNPSCGDELNIYLQLQSSGQNTKIVDIGFHADACAICTASVSLLCEHAKNKSTQQLSQDVEEFCKAINTSSTIKIQSLKCLQAVSAHPSRVNCALLPWQTLMSAMLTGSVNSNNENSRVDCYE